jgi:hypothetical protein
MHQQRKSDPCDNRHRGTQIRFRDHGEFRHSGIRQKAFITECARERQRKQVILVSRDYTGPEAVIDSTVATRSGPLFGKCLNRCDCRNRVQRHVNNAGDTTGRSRTRTGFKAFPFGASGFIDVDVRVNKPRHDDVVADIEQVRARGPETVPFHAHHRSVFDEYTGRPDTVRSEHASGSYYQRAVGSDDTAYCLISPVRCYTALGLAASVCKINTKSG